MFNDESIENQEAVLDSMKYLIERNREIFPNDNFTLDNLKLKEYINALNRSIEKQVVTKRVTLKDSFFEGYPEETECPDITVNGITFNVKGSFVGIGGLKYFVKPSTDTEWYLWDCWPYRLKWNEV